MMMQSERFYNVEGISEEYPSDAYRVILQKR